MFLGYIKLFCKNCSRICHAHVITGRRGFLSLRINMLRGYKNVDLQKICLTKKKVKRSKSIK